MEPIEKPALDSLNSAISIAITLTATVFAAIATIWRVSKFYHQEEAKKNHRLDNLEKSHVETKKSVDALHNKVDRLSEDFRANEAKVEERHKTLVEIFFDRIRRDD